MLAGLIRLMSSCLSFDKTARQSIEGLIDTLDALLSIEDTLEAAAATAQPPAPVALQACDTEEKRYANEE